MSTNLPFADRIAEAAKTIAAIPNFFDKTPCQPQDNVPLMAERYVWERLKALGIYGAQDDELLLSDDCTEGEARRVFCENGEPNLPPVRFKRVWSILKGRRAEQEQSKSDAVTNPHGQVLNSLMDAVKTMRPIGQLTDDELMEMYGQNASAAVIEELGKRAHGRPFVVYKDEAAGHVDCEASLRMLREARRRETPTYYKFSDMLRTLWKAGEFPCEVYEECPLHPDVLLVDGFCDQCGHTWDGVTETSRQLVRIIRDNGRAPKDGPGIRQMIDSSMLKASEGGTPPIVQDYPKDWMEFQRRVEENRLPSLKRRTSSTPAGKQDPFAAGKRY